MRETSMRLIIRAEKLFDGTGAAPRPAEVVVEGERISEVHEGPGTVAVADDQIIEVQDGTLLPGLIDAHVHLLGSGEPDDRGFGLGDIVNSIPTVTLNCLR